MTAEVGELHDFSLLSSEETRPKLSLLVNKNVSLTLVKGGVGRGIFSMDIMNPYWSVCWGEIM